MIKPSLHGATLWRRVKILFLRLLAIMMCGETARIISWPSACKSTYSAREGAALKRCVTICGGGGGPTWCPLASADGEMKRPQSMQEYLRRELERIASYETFDGRLPATTSRAPKLRRRGPGSRRRSIRPGARCRSDVTVVADASADSSPQLRRLGQRRWRAWAAVHAMLRLPPRGRGFGPAHCSRMLPAERARQSSYGRSIRAPGRLASRVRILQQSSQAVRAGTATVASGICFNQRTLTSAW